MVEQLPLKQLVGGSSPSAPTIAAGHLSDRRRSDSAELHYQAPYGPAFHRGRSPGTGNAFHGSPDARGGHGAIRFLPEVGRTVRDDHQQVGFLESRDACQAQHREQVEPFASANSWLDNRPPPGSGATRISRKPRLARNSCMMRKLLNCTNFWHHSQPCTPETEPLYWSSYG